MAAAKRFSIVNLGCKVNRVESDAFAALLESRGWAAASLADASLVVVNTCAVTGEAEKKTRKAVRHALRESGDALVVVTGCAAALKAAEYEALDRRVRVVAKQGVEAFLAEAAGSAPREADVGLLRQEAALPIGPGYPTRVGVKVQDGCNHACTYCIVHVARGKATSRPAREVVDECVALARAGVAEIVLTGINLGSYDDSGLRLAGLLEAILGAFDALDPPASACRLRVSSVEPMDVDDDFIALLADSAGRICRHLHLPLQSGSTRVLREMDRPYTAEDFVGLVQRLRAAVPTLSLGTDVIVGFPGETEADFAATCDAARACRFSKIHVFPYSRRAGTPAADRADQIDPAVKSDRARRLRELGKQLREEDWASRRGSLEAAVVEEAGIAMTESHYAVRAPHNAQAGDVLAVNLDRAVLAEGEQQE
ncbi:tRNA (N(6)-L-threonylcarbamoyladenosine(37)-C(2))-methylthiotransferase MtaB [Xiamenia xianingshaonis]|uniref:tRNA (N(6)-L-threonylcarbamoyladenosine(37)-C(2))- methylthiotransferase MtaB n=1 Tax=Xiamenia xianingshaonis TaxID=2682776 RepID=UPI0021BD06CC|nr:tRNA (N(6)-L-threonylcarbamoyladenosine(37)-C(2))-methylthiotransferase MtaB [Xiamenia xianingshaonis]